MLCHLWHIYCLANVIAMCCCGRCYTTEVDVNTSIYNMLLMADVIAICIVVDGKPMRLGLLPIIIRWQMLLPLFFLADVKTTHIVGCSIRRWQMLLPGGRWNSHCRVGDVK